ncbi:12018_t:CDS:2 [Acaulospora colombiana]|uniref:12018_t:CDS:1 n=1 Tax=Acaulospora colombiana TaxID=27376 RepID=A0ACA9KKV4_9GLOM|nr:12018_t:CDS:2 [Acaulospora colombiana]
MQPEIDSLKQRISELEAEKAELEAKNAELLKQVMEESTKREAENLWDQNQNKNLDKTSQSHKKKGTENIAQVIADGIQDDIISDESEARSFVSSNHVTEISATARRQNSDTISLLDLAQLFDKATNAEYYAAKANQEETLCWINYGKEFVIQYQYAIEHGMDPEKFSVITEAEKNRWAMGCLPADMERDIRFYRGGIERKEDTRKYHKFLTDRERLVGEEL